MVAPVPKPEIVSLIDELVGQSEGATLDEFTAKRIEKRARHLLETGAGDPASCHMALGLLGMYCGDAAMCETGMRNALNLAPNDSVVFRNALIALTPLGNFRECLGLIHRILDNFPDDKGVIGCGMLNAFHCFQFTYALRLAERFMFLSVNDAENTMDPIINMSTLCKNAAANYGMSESDMMERLEIAVEALRQNGHVSRHTTVQVLDDGNMIYQFFIPANGKTCANLNFTIAEALIEKFEDSGIGLFSITCRPFADYLDTKSIALRM